MTAVIYSLFTRQPVTTVIPIRLGDRDLASARGRIGGRWSKHIALSGIEGEVQDIARISGVVMAKLGDQWFEARLIVPTNKDRPL